jgi:hypothetical protein
MPSWLNQAGDNQGEMKDTIILNDPSVELFHRLSEMNSLDRLIVLLGEEIHPLVVPALRGIIFLQDPSWACVAEEAARPWQPLSDYLDSSPTPLLTQEENASEPIALGRVGIFVSNDTHVKTFAPLYSKHPQCVFIPDPTLNENSISQLDRMGFPYIPYDASSIDQLEMDVALLANDWGPFRYAIDQLRKSAIPTMCIQEGCLHFNEPGFPYRMRLADYVGIQGLATVDYLRRRTQFVIGNPRFENLDRRPLPQEHCAMVNSNFTYGIFEEWRDAWLASVIEACERLRIPFFVSRHPRERATRSMLMTVGSGPDIVHGHLEEASLLITRFSSLVYEALMMGRDVIYYNPHDEAMELFNQDRTGGIIQAKSHDELISALKYARSRPVGNVISSERKALFLGFHVGGDPSHASDRLVEALRIVQGSGVPKDRADYLPPNSPGSVYRKTRRVPIKAKQRAASYLRLAAFSASRFLNRG